VRVLAAADPVEFADQVRRGGVQVAAVLGRLAVHGRPHEIRRLFAPSGHRLRRAVERCRLDVQRGDAVRGANTRDLVAVAPVKSISIQIHREE
jgi:hypothetical protein